jgi:hypothetical protein
MSDAARKGLDARSDVADIVVAADICFTGVSADPCVPSWIAVMPPNPVALPMPFLPFRAWNSGDPGVMPSPLAMTPQPFPAASVARDSGDAWFDDAVAADCVNAETEEGGASILSRAVASDVDSSD